MIEQPPAVNGRDRRKHRFREQPIVHWTAAFIEDEQARRNLIHRLGRCSEASVNEFADRHPSDRLSLP